MPGSGTPPSPVTVLDGSSAPTPPPAASCVPPAPGSLRGLSSFATFLEDAVAPNLAPLPEPLRAAAGFHLLSGCPSLPIRAAGRGGRRAVTAEVASRYVAGTSFGSPGQGP